MLYQILTAAFLANETNKLLLYMIRKNNIIKTIAVFFLISVFGNISAQKKSSEKKSAESEGLEWHTDLMKVYDISHKKKKTGVCFFYR